MILFVILEADLSLFIRIGYQSRRIIRPCRLFGGWGPNGSLKGGLCGGAIVLCARLFPFLLVSLSKSILLLFTIFIATISFEDFLRASFTWP